MATTAVDGLDAAVRGRVVEAGAPDYDEARALYNGMIDKHPAAIAYCVDENDVAAAIAFAQQRGLRLAIRGGGHNGGGLGSVDDGLVIDLSIMNEVKVDPSARMVRVQGGATFGQVDAATHEHGGAVPGGVISTTVVGGLTLGGGLVIDLSIMNEVTVDPSARMVRVQGGATFGQVDTATHEHGGAVPVGVISTTGVGGLTLGGGLGHLTRAFGLTIDSLVAATVVLADGSVVTADAEREPDLFWAIRGGGGNFGVVTSFSFRMHPVSTVLAGPTIYSLDDAPEVMRWYRDFISQQPDELSGFFAFLSIPPGPPFPEELHLRKVCGVVWCQNGEEETPALREARSFGKPLLDGIAPLPFPAWNSAFDAVYPAGDQWYWRGDFVNEVPDAAIEKHVEFAQAMPTWKSTMHLYPIDGAASRVANDATAWGYRDAKWSQIVGGVDSDAANAGVISDWAKAYSDAVRPYALAGGYANFQMDEPDRVKGMFGSNYDRLARIKSQYDPGNVFNVNQNIKPA